MSRGLGRIQRRCLDALARGDMDSISIAATVFDSDVIDDAEHRSVLRALHTLRARRLVIDLGRRYRDGRRRWALHTEDREMAAILDASRLAVALTPAGQARDADYTADELAAASDVLDMVDRLDADPERVLRCALFVLRRQQRGEDR